MHHRKMLGFVAATAATLATAVATMSAPASAETGPTVVASGLNSPRQLAFSPGGTLYVAESGGPKSGTNCHDHPELGTLCLVLNGAVAQIGSDGTVTRVVTGLPGLANDSETIGASDLAFTGNRKFAVTVGLAAPPEFRDLYGPQAALLGHVLKGDLKTGSLQDAADMAAYEADANPDGTDVDSNPVGIARWGNSYVIADAGGNAVVRTNGSTLGVFPPVPAFGPAAPFPGFPADAVPTDVVRGPDGAWYVSQLVGFPFEKGASSIWRLEPGSAPTKWATGLTNVTSLAFADDGTLYAVELAENGLLTGPFGRLARITPGGSSHATVAGDLFAPYGVVIRGSHAWVTTNALVPFAGQIVKVALD